MGDRALGVTAPCPDSLAHAAAIGGGFSHLLFMIVSDCAAFPSEESWPLHTDTGMKSCCLFQSVFQHFSLQTASLLYAYQVTSVLGWLPTQLHLGSVAQESSAHYLHKDLCPQGFSAEILRSCGFAHEWALEMGKRSFRFKSARKRWHSCASSRLPKLFSMD